MNTGKAKCDDCVALSEELLVVKKMQFRALNTFQYKVYAALSSMSVGADPRRADGDIVMLMENGVVYKIAPEFYASQ